MTTNRRDALICLAASLGTTRAAAATWPERAIKLVIGHPPGATADVTARALVPYLESAFGQPVIVEYKPGAGGMIAAQQVAAAAPDGYTLYMMDNAPATIIPHMRRNGFDAARSLTLLGTLIRSTNVALVQPGSDIRDVQALMAAANSRRLTYGSSGVGSMQHLAGEMFNLLAKVSIAHVPYKGGAPAINDLLAGQISMTYSSLAPSIPMIQSGKLRPLAVTSRQRAPALPDVPTFAELGLPGLEVMGWFSLAAPAGLPPPISARIESALLATTRNPAFQKRMSELGSETVPGGRAELEALVAHDSSHWKSFFSKVTIAAE